MMNLISCEDLRSVAICMINNERHNGSDEQLGIRHIAVKEPFYSTCEWKKTRKEIVGMNGHNKSESGEL